MAHRAELRRQISASNRRLASALAERRIATVEARELRPIAAEDPPSGSKPIVWLEDGAGARWVFKAAAPMLAAAEQLAYELRRLAVRPVVPARAIQLELHDLGHAGGVLKPFVEFDAHEQLPPDTSAWSPLQRAVMLAEHAWEWWLDDLDANRGQYALLSAERHPVKLDWDRALSSVDPGSPSRFDKYKPILPNARSFLYADWLEGRVALDFDLLRDEARHIARLPREQVRRALARFEEHAELTRDEARDIAVQTLDRQRRAPAEFEHFIRNLLRERAALGPGAASSLGAGFRARGVRIWRIWQLVLDGVFRGPLGDAGRGVLRAWRARAVRAQHENPA